jgi:hypothetical protein
MQLERVLSYIAAKAICVFVSQWLKDFLVYVTLYLWVQR